MEIGSTKHGPALDEQLDHETRSLRQGAPVESRVDERRIQEDSADGEPVPDAVLASAADYGGLTHDEIEARSELASHLRPSDFPASADALRQSARELGAGPQLLERLDALPGGTYGNVAEVWAALGGPVESREREQPASAPAVAETPEPAEAPEPPPDAARESQRFEFTFDPLFRAIDFALGITPSRAYVELDGDRVVAQFGRWRVETTRDNVAGAEVTGPYALPKVIGPPHLSIRDRGLTFATNAARGVCIRFREPVTGIEPLGLIRHPGLTVTVADPDALAEALGTRG